MDGQNETTARGSTIARSCHTAGCSCQDGRIVSHRRAAFFAAVAQASGETADRRIAPEPDWRLPAESTTD
jgi:hypothetical protein